jgi:hypothetical protein
MTSIRQSVMTIDWCKCNRRAILQVLEDSVPRTKVLVNFAGNLYRVRSEDRFPKTWCSGHRHARHMIVDRRMF